MARMPDFELPDPMPADDARDGQEPGVGAPEPDDAGIADSVGDASPDGSPVGSPDGSPVGSALRARWHRIRVPVVAFAAGAAIAIAGAVAIDVVQERAEHDDVVAAVDAYVAAVESADAAGRTPWVDETVASSALLVAAIPVAAPPDVVCDAPRLGAELASVDCRVRVDGRTEQTTMTLEHDGIGWHVVRGLEVPVRIQSGALLVDAIGGVPIDEAIARGQRAVWLLPGRYDVDVRTPEQLVVERLDGLAVSVSGGVVRWETDTVDTVDVAAVDAALAFVDACAASAADGCPAIQPRDPVESFEAFAVIGRLAPDDPYALTYEVSVRRPVEQPTEYLVVTVRVDFGEDLDRYDVAVVPSG